MDFEAILGNCPRAIVDTKDGLVSLRRNQDGIAVVQTELVVRSTNGLTAAQVKRTEIIAHLAIDTHKSFATVQEILQQGQPVFY